MRSSPWTSNICTTMLRKALTAVGLGEVLSPEALIDTVEGIALENPDECEIKPWVVPVARGEGHLDLFLAWRSDAAYGSFKKVLCIIGVL